MKRKIILSSLFLGIVSLLWAQPDKIKYPEPEFSKEVYFLKKDTVNSVLRLEKEISKMEGKTKMGGMGGYENGYTIEGEKSSVRLPSGNGLSFVFSSGALTRVFFTRIRFNDDGKWYGSFHDVRHDGRIG